MSIDEASEAAAAWADSRTRTIRGLAPDPETYTKLWTEQYDKKFWELRGPAKRQTRMDAGQRLMAKVLRPTETALSGPDGKWIAELFDAANRTKPQPGISRGRSK
jgi:hypothetical protein